MSEAVPPEAGPAPTTPPPRHRSELKKRLPVLLVLGALFWWSTRATPHDVTLVYDLGARQSGLTELRVDLTKNDSGALARHAEFHYGGASPAPSEQNHTVRLARGGYQAHFTLVYPDHRDDVTRPLQYDGEERVELRL